MSNIIAIFNQIFNEKKFQELARKKQFVKRNSSRLKGQEYIKSLILFRSDSSKESLRYLCKHIKKINPLADISPQALAKRINSKESASLLQSVFCEVLNHLRTIMLKSPPLKTALSMFPRVIIQDSTTVTLNAKLSNEFKGTNRGGTSGKSQLKIDVIHDVMHDQMVDAALFNGNMPDQGLSDRVVSFLKEGDLLIRDLGYFSTQAFELITKIGYFLSRINANVNIYLNKFDENPIDLGEYLRKNHKGINVIDLPIFLGKNKMPCRLVIYRQPEEVTNKRLRALHKNRRKKGETLSANRKTLASYSMFVTNVPKDQMSAEVIGTVYRLRWEIELIFKQWKSQLNIHVLKGINPNRIKTLIWSRLCMVLLLSLMQNGISRNFEFQFKTEISPSKFINYLKFGNVFYLAVIENGLEELLSMIGKDLDMICKDRRRRMTMRERIESGELYYSNQYKIKELDVVKNT